MDKKELKKLKKQIKKNNELLLKLAGNNIKNGISVMSSEIKNAASTVSQFINEPIVEDNNYEEDLPKEDISSIVSTHIREREFIVLRENQYYNNPDLIDDDTDDDEDFVDYEYSNMGKEETYLSFDTKNLEAEVGSKKYTPREAATFYNKIEYLEDYTIGFSQYAVRDDDNCVTSKTMIYDELPDNVSYFKFLNKNNIFFRIKRGSKFEIYDLFSGLPYSTFIKSNPGFPVKTSPRNHSMINLGNAIVIPLTLTTFSKCL